MNSYKSEQRNTSTTTTILDTSIIVQEESLQQTNDVKDNFERPLGTTSNDWRQLSQLFTRAGVVRILIDGKVRAFLPGSDTNTLRVALDVLEIDDLDRFSDLVVISKTAE